MKSLITIGVIGLGGRGMGLMEACVLPRAEVTVTAVCDVHEDRGLEAAKRVEKTGRPRPLVTGDYREVLGMKDLDAGLVSPGWTPHVEIA